MPDAVADTHALIQYLEDSPRLGKAENQVFEQCDRGEIRIFISTISLVEIIYLHRISANFVEQLQLALEAKNSGLVVVDLTSDIVYTLAKIPRNNVPDMPDRLIAATAKYLDLPLISRDSRMPMTGVELIG